MGAHDLKTFKFDGKNVTLSEIDAYALDTVAKVMRWNHRSITVIQGGGRKTSSYSADTHNKSAFDLTTNAEKDKERILRSIGVMYYIRPTLPGHWNRHGHGATLHQPAKSASQGLRNQFSAYLRGRDGLARNGPDTGWKPVNRNVRLRFGAREGEWIAKRQTQGYTGAFAQSGPTSGGKVSKGSVIENVCTVVCGSNTFLVASPSAGKLVFYPANDFDALEEARSENVENRYVTMSNAVYGRETPGLSGVKKVVKRGKGFVFDTNIRVQHTDGRIYVSTPECVWYTETSLNPVKKHEAMYEVASSTAYGRVTPGIGGVEKVATKKKGDIIKSTDKAYHAAGKADYIRDEDGHWYALTSLKELAPSNSIDVVVATQNVIVHRLSSKKPSNVTDWKKGADYKDRLPIMLNLLKSHKPTIIATQEAGGKTHSSEFNKIASASLGGTWNDVLYGDGWDITQTVTDRSDIYTTLKRGYVKVTPDGLGRSHNIWTYKILEEKKSKKQFLVATFHLEHRKGSTYDKARENQCLSGIEQIEEIADGLPVIFLGDANSAKEDSYDGPGRAFDSRGYTDVENTPCPVVNPEFDSYNALNTNPRKNKRQIDRAFIKLGDITATKRVVVIDGTSTKYNTPFGSDHWAVVFNLTIK